MGRLAAWCVLFAVLTTGCARDPGSGGATTDPRTAPTVDLMFGGDVMLGRGVAPIAHDDPWSIFADARVVLGSADITVANLESPLTRSPHTAATSNALEADPRSARILRAAGFDAMSVANNHASDAGAATSDATDTALHREGIDAIGLAPRPVVETRNGVRVAFLAFDTSPRAIAPVAVARWDPATARDAVRTARGAADVVTVSLHGGLDYRPDADLWLTALGTKLARWGADVVWGHGPHVVQPVRTIDPDGDGRNTVLATSLGNLVFDDQGIPGTDRGALLEVRARADGVVAYRVGATRIDAGRVSFERWLTPDGEAVAFDGGWWHVARPLPAIVDAGVPDRLPSFPGPAWDVRDAASGDVNGDGVSEVVVAFRRAFSAGPQMPAEPGHAWRDDDGRKTMVGVYRAGDLAPLWVSTSVRRPVALVIPCGDVLVVAYSTLNDPTIVATGSWPWRGFGFTSSVDLPGAGTPGCVDVDADGSRDPVVTGRSG